MCYLLSPIDPPNVQASLRGLWYTPMRAAGITFRDLIMALDGFLGFIAGSLFKRYNPLALPQR